MQKVIEIIESDFIVYEGSFVTVLGNSKYNNLGKMILGLENIDENIKIFNSKLKNNKKIRKKIKIVSNYNNKFSFDTVLEELLMSSSESLQKKEVEKICEMFGIDHLLEYNPKYLSAGEQELINIIRASINNPKLLILDNAFSNIANKNKIINVFKKINHDVTIINFTSDSEESLYGNRIILVKEEKILANGTTKEVLKKEKYFKEINVELPFMADLSLKLQYYNLIDDIILNMDKMVKTLWK